MELRNYTRAEILSHAAYRLRRGATEYYNHAKERTGELDAYQRGYFHGMGNAASVLQYGLAVQPDELYWKDATAPEAGLPWDEEEEK